MIKCGMDFLDASNIPRIPVYAAVVKMAFVAYRARSGPVMSTINPWCHTTYFVDVPLKSTLPNHAIADTHPPPSSIYTVLFLICPS